MPVRLEDVEPNWSDDAADAQVTGRSRRTRAEHCSPGGVGLRIFARA